MANSGSRRRKTERAVREVPLTTDVVARLREHRAAQMRRRLELGSLWEDTDLIVDRGNGGPVDPDSFTHAFGKIARRAGVPGVRPLPDRKDAAREANFAIDSTGDPSWARAVDPRPTRARGLC
jgi:integrase